MLGGTDREIDGSRLCPALVAALAVHEVKAFIERLYRTLTEECAWPDDFDSLDEALAAITAWVEDYNHDRPQDSLQQHTRRGKGSGPDNTQFGSLTVDRRGVVTLLTAITWAQPRSSGVSDMACDIRIVAILTANDDGSQAASPSPAAITQSVGIANAVYTPHGISLLFDPATDIYRFNDDLLNRDCWRRDQQVYTDPMVDPTNDPALGADVMNQRRNEIARRFPGRLAIYFTAGSRYTWSDKEGRWVYGRRGSNWSNSFDEFVSMAILDEYGDFLAHEIGHYLHLSHTFGPLPASVADAVTLIQNLVEGQGVPKDQVTGQFDADAFNVADTPPDPGPGIFKNQCDPAESSASIPVSFADGSSRTYTFAPDRENVMNYWNKTCRGGGPRISPGQATAILDALRTGNRRHLVEPAILYFGSFGQGDRSQTRAIAWAFGDFATRFDNELAARRRCTHMQAYDIGGGQIRYDGVWEPANGVGQTRAIAWAIGDLATRFDNELAAGRHCTHMQAYDIGGGQIRYDAVWESGGDHGQSWVIGWAREHFVVRWEQETAGGRRLTRMQAYDIGGGQIRYDGVWEPANGVVQGWVMAWAIGDFATRFDAELAAGRHCTHMQAYDIGGGQIRYDAVWESDGDHGQSRAISWAFNDFVERWDQEAAAGKRLTRMQAYDIGDGNLRYDGIWETPHGRSGEPQRRVLGHTQRAFADHFDELTSSGTHVEHMSACRRAYADLPAADVDADDVATRALNFGSDFDSEPASLALLPIPPLRIRGPGCDLGR